MPCGGPEKDVCSGARSHSHRHRHTGRFTDTIAGPRSRSLQSAHHHWTGLAARASACPQALLCAYSPVLPTPIWALILGVCGLATALRMVFARPGACLDCPGSLCLLLPAPQLPSLTQRLQQANSTGSVVDWQLPAGQISVSAAVVIDVSRFGRPVSVRIASNGSTTLDCNGRNQAFIIRGAQDVSLVGLTIQNCAVPGTGQGAQKGP